MDELIRYGLTISDLPICDKSIDLTLLAEQASAEMAMKESYEALTLMFKEERDRSDNLLHRYEGCGCV